MSHETEEKCAKPLLLEKTSIQHQLKAKIMTFLGFYKSLNYRKIQHEIFPKINVCFTKENQDNERTSSETQKKFQFLILIFLKRFKKVLGSLESPIFPVLSGNQKMINSFQLRSKTDVFRENEECTYRGHPKYY